VDGWVVKGRKRTALSARREGKSVEGKLKGSKTRPGHQKGTHSYQKKQLKEDSFTAGAS